MDRKKHTLPANPGDLPENCDKFCEWCKNKWWKILGEP
jgi:hypothetical protein